MIESKLKAKNYNRGQLTPCWRDPIRSKQLSTVAILGRSLDSAMSLLCSIVCQNLSAFSEMPLIRHSVQLQWLPLQTNRWMPGAHYPDGCGMGNPLSPNLAYIFMAISWNQMLSDPQTHHSLPITMLMTVSLMVLALMVSLFLSCRKSPRPEARVPVPIASPPSCTPVLPYVRGLSEQLRRCPQ